MRFLQQAAFGPNGDLQQRNEVMTKGFDNWITEQFARPVGLHQPYFDHLKRAKHGESLLRFQSDLAGGTGR